MQQEEKNRRIMKFLERDYITEEIGEFCRSVWKDYYKDEYNPEDESYSTMVTLGVDCDDDGNVTFGLQSGDNSYTGNAYGFQYWGVVYPYPATADEYATELIESVEETLPW
jgi:hypothetical protein